MLDLLACFMWIPVELARCLLQLIIKRSQLFMSSKFGFYPNAVWKAFGCFYSAIRFIFFFCCGRRLLTSVVALSKRSMRLKSLTNLTVAGKQEHTFWGTLLWSLLVQRRICWCFSVLSVWKPLKCSKQINNDFCSFICHFFVTALLRDQRGKSSRNPVKYLGDQSVWGVRGKKEGWGASLIPKW